MSEVPDGCAEAVLLTVRRGTRRVDVAALADVPLRHLAAALARLAPLAADDDHGGGTVWELHPARPSSTRWPQDTDLRGLGVLDGAELVLLSAARS